MLKIIKRHQAQFEIYGEMRLLVGDIDERGQIRVVGGQFRLDSIRRAAEELRQLDCDPVPYIRQQQPGVAEQFSKGSVTEAAVNQFVEMVVSAVTGCRIVLSENPTSHQVCFDVLEILKPGQQQSGPGSVGRWVSSTAASLFDVFHIAEISVKPAFTRPAINRDLTIVREALDGEVIGPIGVESIRHQWYEYLGGNRTQWSTAEDIQTPGASLLLTEARYVICCPRYKTAAGSTLDRRRPRTALTAQLRHPWIRLIAFEASPGHWPYVDLRFRTATSALQSLVAYFAPDVDVARLAYQLAQRAGAYRRAETEPLSPDDARGYDDLLRTGPITMSPSNNWGGVYKLPVPREAETGADVAPPAPPSQIDHRS